MALKEYHKENISTATFSITTRGKRWGWRGEEAKKTIVYFTVCMRIWSQI